MSHDRHCQEILKELSAYIDDELEARLCAEIEAHLAGCPDCQAMVDTLRKTVILYRRSEPDDLPPDVRDRLYKVLHLDDLE